jgi:hypothetical protein
MRCMLHSHNCLGNDAVRPALPEVLPMTTFRGQPLTHDAAEAGSSRCCAPGHWTPAHSYSERLVAVVPARCCVSRHWMPIHLESKRFGAVSYRAMVGREENRSESVSVTLFFLVWIGTL